jgi:hypothetical protein
MYFQLQLTKRCPLGAPRSRRPLRAPAEAGRFDSRERIVQAPPDMTQTQSAQSLSFGRRWPRDRRCVELTHTSARLVSFDVKLLRSYNLPVDE